MNDAKIGKLQELYTVDEIAKKLKVKKGYVYELIYTQKIKAVKLSERRFRISQKSYEDFIQQQEFNWTAV